MLKKLIHWLRQKFKIGKKVCVEEGFVTVMVPVRVPDGNGGFMWIDKPTQKPGCVKWEYQ